MKRFRSALFALGAIFVLAAGCSTTGKGPDAKAVDGVYAAVRKGINGDVKVEVTIAGDRIEKITVLESSETPAIGGDAMKALIGKIVAGQTLAVDSISGASYSSKALLGAVEDCLKQAKANVQRFKKPAAAKAASTKTIVADVVVIGAGGSGTSAAVTAAEHGAKVVVLEKTAVPGGTTANGGGFFAADSRKSRAIGEAPVDVDLLFAKYMKEMSWKVDANLVRQYFDLSRTTADWLEDRGLIFHKTAHAVQQSHEVGMNGYHKYDDFTKTVSQYKAWIEKTSKERALTVYYSTPATDLIVDASGAVHGVIAKTQDGSTLRVEAKSVIIATGGFVGNEKMTTEALGGVKVKAAGYNSNVGDGINMAWKIGAAHRGTEAMVAHIFDVAGSGAVEGSFPGMSLYYGTNSIAYLATIPWLNAQGRRYANEDIVYDRALSTNALMAQGDYAWFLYAEDMLDKLDTVGAGALGLQESVAMGPMPDITPIKTPWTGVKAIADQLVQKGYVVKAATLDELAAKTGMDPAILKATMSRYNADAEKHVDSLFGKRGAHMYPLTAGPYYAYKVGASNLCTVGGIRINSGFQVVKSNPDQGYTAIPNLYAAGADAGGIYSDHYAFTIEGTAQGWAYNSGRLAGARATEHALGTGIDLVAEDAANLKK
jgi:fumarate reductase flavoprotein subunit